MTSGTAMNSEPDFASIEQAAAEWMSASSEYSAQIKLCNAAKARRDRAGAFLSENLSEGNMIMVEGRCLRFFYRLRNTPSWSSIYTAIRSLVAPDIQAMMDTAKDNNTKSSRTPALEEIPVNMAG